MKTCINCALAAVQYDLIAKNGDDIDLSVLIYNDNTKAYTNQPDLTILRKLKEFNKLNNFYSDDKLNKLYE